MSILLLVMESVCLAIFIIYHNKIKRRNKKLEFQLNDTMNRLALSWLCNDLEEEASISIGTDCIITKDFTCDNVLTSITVTNLNDNKKNRNAINKFLDNTREQLISYDISNKTHTFKFF